MTDPVKPEPDQLSDDQLEGVSGGVSLAITATTVRRASSEKGGTEDINIGVIHRMSGGVGDAISIRQ